MDRLESMVTSYLSVAECILEPFDDFYECLMSALSMSYHLEMSQETKSIRKSDLLDNFKLQLIEAVDEYELECLDPNLHFSLIDKRITRIKKHMKRDILKGTTSFYLHQFISDFLDIDYYILYEESGEVKSTISKETTGYIYKARDSIIITIYQEVNVGDDDAGHDKFSNSRHKYCLTHVLDEDDCHVSLFRPDSDVIISLLYPNLQ
ncbi:MAG: hypothetical protein GY751_00290 [Bacteroidetes bacterium]|nr:hypothetical protein [Bacteroidota bacterium]